MLQAVLLGCQAELLAEGPTEVVGGLEARDAGNSDDFFVGLAQHFPGAIEANAAQFLHRGANKVISKGLFQAAARHGNVPDDIGHADRKMGVFLDVPQGRGYPRVIDRHAVGAATFDNAGRRDVKGIRRRGFAADQSLEQCSAFVADLFEVIVDT